MIFNKQKHRSSDVRDDRKKTFFRSNRSFKNDNSWFFETREKRHVGPYQTMDDCERGCNLYIQAIIRDSKNIEYAITMAKHGAWNVLSFK